MFAVSRLALCPVRAVPAGMKVLSPFAIFIKKSKGDPSLAGLPIAEVPVRPVYRGEQSRFRPWHLAGVGYVIGRLGLRRLAAVRGGSGGTSQG